MRSTQHNSANEMHAPRQGKPPHGALLGLTLLTLLIHGYHPNAEDGGTYAAGVLYRLNPSLFPHDSAFADAHRAYSLFDPLIVLAVRASHLSLDWVLLIAHLGCLWLLLYAAWRLGVSVFESSSSGLFAAATLGAVCTLPVAGTSLLLMEPYLTARSFSTPLSLLAVALLPPSSTALFRQQMRRAAPAALCLLLSAALHPLMAVYALALIVAWKVAAYATPRARWLGWLLLAATACVVAGILQVTASPETPPMLAADFSRSYWFLSNWRWYELLGLAGPIAVFALLHRYTRRSATPGAALFAGSIAIALVSTLVAFFFARKGMATHFVARLQPLRAFLLPYAVMVAMLGALLGRSLLPQHPRSQRARRAIPATFLLAAFACIMFSAERQTFPASPHLELPNRSASNPWVEAFLWARFNTPTDALFALDADYITLPGEDAHTFRSIAQRSQLCDFAKDGGTAANHPELAATWQADSAATAHLSKLSDAERDRRLQPRGVTWMLLRSTSPTAHNCPYSNGTVKLCTLPLNTAR